MIFYSKKGRNWIKDSNFQTVSIIIPTYNEEVVIEKKLKNVLAQDYPKEYLELIIIDSGSSDKTTEIIKSFIKQNPNTNITLILEKERLGKSHAVNVAYSKSSGAIKIISDADALLEKTAITKIVSNFNDQSVGAAFGRQVLINKNQSSSLDFEKRYQDFYQVLRQGESIMDSTPIFHGELAAYRTNLIEKLPENKSADDSRLANIIRCKGYRTVYDSSAVFYEYAPPNPKARFTQKVRRGQGLIRVFWDFKHVLFRRKYGKYGLLIMPMEFFMHCISPILILLFLATFLVGLALFNPFIQVILAFSFLILFGLSRIQSENIVLKIERTLVNTVLNFLSLQLTLLYSIALLIRGKSLHKWQKVEDIRREWKVNQKHDAVTYV